MDKILTPLIDGITSGNLLVIAIIAAIAIIFNIEKIFSFVDMRKKVKINLIEESIKNSHVSGNTKLFLERLIETEYFKAITGISLEKEIREALLHVQNEANGELKFKHFKRAIPYINYKNNTLSVEISLFTKLGFLYNAMNGLLSIVGGFILFILPAFSSELSVVKFFSIYGVAIAVICFGGLMLLQCLPVISAIYVNQYLEKSHNTLKSKSD